MYAVVMPIEKHNKTRYKVIRLFFKKSRMSHHLGVAMRQLYLNERSRVLGNFHRSNGYTYLTTNRCNNDIVVMLEHHLDDYYNNIGKSIAVMDIRTRQIIT